MMRTEERKPDKYWAYRFVFTHSDHDLFLRALPRGYLYYWAAEDFLRRHFGTSDPEIVRKGLWAIKSRTGKDFRSILNEALRRDLAEQSEARDDSDRN